MNGTIFEELKKKELSQKKEKFKFAVALVLTNALVAISTWSLFADTGTVPKQARAKKALHAHHKVVIAPLTLLAENIDGLSEFPVTLMNKNKKVMVQKAYLLEEVKAGKAQDLGQSRFKIEIPEEEIVKVSEEISEGMIAIPEIKPKKSQASAIRKVSKYEINL